MKNKWQYISQGRTAEEQLYHIGKALDCGADWIQLRWKNATYDEYLKLAENIKQYCEKYQATFIVNDNVAIASVIEADGVHLGLGDMPIVQARAILGVEKIIGGTANTYQDVQRRVLEKCDYIGLGPFRFTATKEKLSPFLGLEGYKTILTRLRKEAIKVPPIFAIGGIKLEDIVPILDSGVYGVALSGMVTEHPELIDVIKASVYGCTTNSR